MDREDAEVKVVPGTLAAAALTGMATAADVHMAQAIRSRIPGAKGATANGSLRGRLRYVMIANTV
jgi:hypothetical protein